MFKNYILPAEAAEVENKKMKNAKKQKGNEY